MENTTPIKILLVDDDRFLLNMYSIKFKKSGFDVETAIGGAEALEKLRAGFTPDVLVLDVVMPTMDGFELLETIRKERLAEKALAVILTNQGQMSDIERAKKLGVASYIVKASTIPSEVVEQVAAVVGKTTQS